MLAERAECVWILVLINEHELAVVYLHHLWNYQWLGIRSGFLGDKLLLSTTCKKNDAYLITTTEAPYFSVAAMELLNHRHTRLWLCWFQVKKKHNLSVSKNNVQQTSITVKHKCVVSAMYLLSFHSPSVTLAHCMGGSPGLFLLKQKAATLPEAFLNFTRWRQSNHFVLILESISLIKAKQTVWKHFQWGINLTIVRLVQVCFCVGSFLHLLVDVREKKNTHYDFRFSGAAFEVMSPLRPDATWVRWRRRHTHS